MPLPPPQHFGLCTSSDDILKHKKIVDDSLEHGLSIKDKKLFPFQCIFEMRGCSAFLCPLESTFLHLMNLQDQEFRVHSISQTRKKEVESTVEHSAFVRVVFHPV